MISIALISGLAGLWVWTVLNDEDGIFGWFTRLTQKTTFTEKWLTCPWCSGAWFGGGFAVILGLSVGWENNLAGLGVITVAAAAVTGLIGSYLSGGE